MHPATANDPVDLAVLLRDYSIELNPRERRIIDAASERSDRGTGVCLTRISGADSAGHCFQSDFCISLARCRPALRVLFSLSLAASTEPWTGSAAVGPVPAMRRRSRYTISHAHRTRSADRIRSSDRTTRPTPQGEISLEQESL
jgi:hypothetical protein